MRPTPSRHALASRAARGVVLLALFVLLCGAAACSNGARSARAPDQVRRPDQWSDCGEGWQCRAVTVPVDPAHPGPSIDLAVVRLPAARRTERIGPLFVNPGGPGESAVAFARSFAATLAPEIRDRFDIVAFDPRGVGASGPIDCDTAVDSLFAGVDLAPEPGTQQRRLEDANRAFADACARGPSAALLGHVDTPTIARDMDAVRAALGAETLSYLGFSWGTYLGAWYAELFPTRVRAMVLDGAVDPAVPVDRAVIQQSESFDRSLAMFLFNCARRSTCAFHAGENPSAAYDALVARVAADPLRTDRGEVGPSEFDIAVGSYLYGGQRAWDSLASALLAAEKGDGRALRAAYDAYVGDTGSGDDGSYESYLALTCGDTPPVGDAAAYADLARRAASTAPHFGASTVNLGLVCAYWPVKGTNAPRPLRAAGAPPILVVGSEGDPATPIEWARGLAAQLESGVLVTSDGSEHTAYGSSACVEAAVNDYLVDLTVPHGLVCTGG